MATRTFQGAETTTAVVEIDGGWSSRVQWGAILAGGLAGFGVTVIMASLGAAIGATVVSAVDDPGRREHAFIGGAVGAAVWAIVSAILVGISGGCVLARTSRQDRTYLPGTFGLITWATGVALALFVFSQGMGGMTGGLGVGAAGRPDLRERIDPTADRDVPAAREERPVLSGEERDKVEAGAAAAGWVVVGAQIISLAATMLAANWRRRRVVPVAVTTQRPSPAPGM